MRSPARIRLDLEQWDFFPADTLLDKGIRGHQHGEIGSGLAIAGSQQR